ncbi:uncharacterized protein LOC124461031 [Drosophila willistoni]|uniref:uncharacterized protein LOC124461031 n=1 Tax=Drosophila willistoni TaxID=7260 RepID=UPI001F08561D|nr:uncharacterized protein LOC124461031 [Drosophila willistoni]
MPFTVITDHSSLQWLMTLKDINGRLARWSLALQSYDFVIEHKKGKDNVVADMLSWTAVIEELNFFDFETTEFESEEYRQRYKCVLSNPDKFPDLHAEDGLVLKRMRITDNEIGDVAWKLWIPEALTHTLIQQAHYSEEAMHIGHEWPCKSKITLLHVIRVRRRNIPRRRPDQLWEPRPIQKLYLDFLGKYPRSRKSNAYILIVLDHFTKFVWLKTMPKATSAATIKFLREELFNTFGVPEIVHTDNGKQFTSKEFEEMVSHFGITHTRTAAYSPQANASERVNQSILTAKRTHVGEDHS